MKTRDGIYTNINESDYMTELNNVKFYFSSKFYQRKFIDEISNFIKIETQKIEEKYKLKVNFVLFFAIAIYKRIEKRRF